MVDGVMVDGAASSGGRVAAGADSGSGTGSRRGRRNDPDRRDRLVDACLDVIARDGVAGTSHRKVAAQAGVPLGSTTYYFAGMGELLHAAFERFSHSVSDRFEARMEAADTPEEVREAVAAIILQDVFTSQRDLVLSHEALHPGRPRPRLPRPDDRMDGAQSCGAGAARRPRDRPDARRAHRGPDHSPGAGCAGAGPA